MQPVFISKHLCNTDRGRAVAKKLHEILGNSLKAIERNKNEWIRDWAPIRASDGSPILFQYRPSYLVGRITYEKTIPEKRRDLLKEIRIEAESTIILDGGAIEVFGSTGIISDRVIADNHAVWNAMKPEILTEIKSLLKLSRLIVVPSDPWDFTHHVDGLVRFIDEKNVVVNQMDSVDRQVKRLLSENKMTSFEEAKYHLWKMNFRECLTKSGFKIHLLVCGMGRNKNDKDATGNYLNFLRMDDIVLVPEYRGLRQENNDARETLKRFFNRKVVSIDVTDLAEEGGAVNCVTWT